MSNVASVTAPKHLKYFHGAQFGQPSGRQRTARRIRALRSHVAAVGEMLDRMQTQLEKQAVQIADYQKEVRDLTMHKEAAYGEMTKAETAMRTAKERADRAEHMCQQLTISKHDAEEKLKRLLAAVQTTFARARTTLALGR